MTRTVRVVAAALLLSTLTAATGRECTGEAGTVPQRGNPQDRDLILLAEGTARTAHITIMIDKLKAVDEEQTLPSRIHITLHPDEFLEFTVVAIRLGSGVKCTIMSAGGKVIDHDPPKGYAVHADCKLAALKERA